MLCVSVPKLVSVSYSSNDYKSALVWYAFTQHIYIWRQTQKKALTYNTRTKKIWVAFTTFAMSIS